MRLFPELLQDLLVKMLWYGIPSSRLCDLAFPTHLRRWSNIRGRVPVIDKYGVLAAGFESGELVGHGTILDIAQGGEVLFSDQPLTGVVPDKRSRVIIEMVILATGYQEECVIGREDRLNGLYKCGFAKSDRFLPLQSICEEAKFIAEDIAASY